MRSLARSTIGQLQAARTALAVSPKNSSSPRRWVTPITTIAAPLATSLMIALSGVPRVRIAVSTATP